MNQKHTNEPWIFGAEVGADSTRIETASGRVIGSIVTRTVSIFEHGRPIYSWSDEGHANARRMIAAVNACAGCDTEWLEAWANPDQQIEELFGPGMPIDKSMQYWIAKAAEESQKRADLAAALSATVAQRDDLLAALARTRNMIRSNPDAAETCANDAIASVKGAGHV